MSILGGEDDQFIREWKVKQRLSEIRAAIEDEHVSYGELFELSQLKEHIDKDDITLLMWAGVPEPGTE